MVIAQEHAVARAQGCGFCGVKLPHASQGGCLIRSLLRGVGFVVEFGRPSPHLHGHAMRIQTLKELRTVMGFPSERTLAKIYSRLTPQAVDFIGRSPLLVMATSGREA